MMTIEIKINGRLIGGATVANVSNLADVSDYNVTVVEARSEVTGLEDFRQDFQVKDHYRPQSAWELVLKIAQEAASLRRGGRP